MIQINLLDQSQAKNRTRRARVGGGGGANGSTGNLIVAVAALAMLALNGGVAWTAFQKVYSAGDEARNLSRKIRTVENQIAKSYQSSQQIRDFEEVVNNQKEVLRTLDPPDRILWCEKINMLANLIPSNVFVSQIDINEVVVMVETDQSRLQLVVTLDDVVAVDAWSRRSAKERIHQWAL